MRAFEEVWDRAPHGAQALDSELASLRDSLADQWVGGQLRYHTNAAQKQSSLKWWLIVIVYLAFALTLVCAAVEAILVGVGVAHRAGDIARALTIVLPVFGASVGAWLTINQPGALSARSERMCADLRGCQAEIRAAADAHALTEATMSATRLIAPETGSWFGAMWFLDIEHP